MKEVFVRRTTAYVEPHTHRQQFENGSDGLPAPIAITSSSSINPTAETRPTRRPFVRCEHPRPFSSSPQSWTRSRSAMLAGTGRPCAASPSTPPTRAKRFVATCRRTNIGSSSWSSGAEQDWLESACRQGVRCDVLVISGHYDGGNEFFSDQLDVREFLPVNEMERVSCSNSCPGFPAAEGGLSLRMQHAQPGAAHDRIRRDRAQSCPVRPLALRKPIASRAN